MIIICLHFDLIDKFQFYQQVKNILSPSVDRVAFAVACESLGLEKLCDQDYRFLSEFVTVIKPIANAITYLEGDVQTFGSYLPMLFSVRQELRDLYLKDDFEFCRALLLAVKNGFDKRFGHLMDLSNPFERGDSKAVPLFLAMLTNPDYKLNFIPTHWFHGNAEGFNQIKSLLLNAMKQYLKDEKQEQEDKTNNSEQDTNAQENSSEKGMPSGIILSSI